MGKLRRSFRKPSLLMASPTICGRTAVVLISLASIIGAVGCSSNGSSSLPSECYKGPPYLTLQPSLVRPSQTVTISTRGNWGLNVDKLDTTVDSYGMLDRVSGGRLISLWYLGALVSGDRNGSNVRAGTPEGVGGTALPARPFKVRTPPVPNGSYVVQFGYSVSFGPTGTHPTVRNLCGSLKVKA
jgi:hypothetical protein